MDITEIKKIAKLINGGCMEIKCEDCEYRLHKPCLPCSCALDEGKALIEAVKIIEDQEERIAIMSEGGWHDAKKDPPKKPGTYIVYVKVLGERIPYVSFCDYQIKTTGFDLEGEAMVLKWQSMPTPPKEGEA